MRSTVRNHVRAMLSRSVPYPVPGPSRPAAGRLPPELTRVPRRSPTGNPAGLSDGQWIARMLCNLQALPSWSTRDNSWTRHTSALAALQNCPSTGSDSGSLPPEWESVNSTGIWLVSNWASFEVDLQICPCWQCYLLLSTRLIRYVAGQWTSFWRRMLS